MTVANIQILLKRGNTTASSAYTGPLGELTLDTTLKGLRIHDGVRAGGNLIVQNQLTNGANTVSLDSRGNVTLPTGASIVNGYPGPDGDVGGGQSWFVTPSDRSGGVASSDGKQYIQVDTNGLFIGTNYTATTGNDWTFGQDGTTTFPGLITTTGNIITTGNLITAGGRIDSGYQFYSPTANIAVTANVNVSRVILAPTGTIISFGANVRLPAGNVDAKVITVSSNVTIAQLAVYGPVGTSVSPGGNITLGAGNVAQYFYHSATTKWYKVG
jgi:hypothetical protein